MNKNLKISSTAYRVLLLLKLLNERSYNIDELNRIFLSDPFILKTLSKEVILKYLSTLRSSGYKISKPTALNEYRYHLVEAPIAINLSDNELETIVILENYVSGLYQTRLVELYGNFLKNISRYLSKDSISTMDKFRKTHQGLDESFQDNYAQYQDLIKQFEIFCKEDQRIIVKYQYPCDEEEKDIVLEPKLIKYNQNEVFISGYNPIIGERQLINLSYVIEIKQLPIKSKHNNTLSPVIFILKGRVAKGYRLYEDERILESDAESGTIRIAAYVDDKNMLLKRLLKYGDYCEVLYPKSLRENVIALIGNALNNYATL